MTRPQPSALIIARDAQRRRWIGAVLRDTGFAAPACAQVPAGSNERSRHKFDLAVITGQERDGSDALTAARQVRDGRPDIKLLLLVPAGGTPLASNDDDIRVMACPLDRRRLGAAVRELMAAEGAGPASLAAAELGVIEAQLACLFNRRAEAERYGATTRARDIAHQIGDAKAARQSLLQSRGVPFEGDRFSA